MAALRFRPGGLFSLISPRRRHLSILCFVSGLIMTDLPPSVLLDSPADTPSVMEMGGESFPHQLERGRLDGCENYANTIIWTRDINCCVLLLVFSRYRLEFNDGT